MEAFEELLGLDEERGKFLNLRVGEKILPPKRNAAGKLLVGFDEFLDALVDDLVQLLDGLDAALCDHHRLAGRQIHQLEQRLEAGDIPILGPFDVFEIQEVGNRRGGECGETGGVELRAGDGEHGVAGMNQCG